MRNIIFLSTVCFFLMFTGTGIAEEKSSAPADETRLRKDAAEAYFWGWPLANIYNRRLSFTKLSEPTLLDGFLPVAPLNHLAMLNDYIDPAQRQVACPNQDVVYGSSVLALDIEPVVVQVPDFGNRFWIYQAVDLRTDAFVQLGSPYKTEPGFYLLVGPDWQGEKPAGIHRISRSPTSTGYFIPRIFQRDSEEDKKEVRRLITGIGVYPLSKYDGKMKITDWSRTASTGKGAAVAAEGEKRQVFPESFFDQLPTLLADAPPLSGEEEMYEKFASLADRARNDPAARKIMVDEARKTDENVIDSFLRFDSFGKKLPDHWTNLVNGAAFGRDYRTRTAVARSNIFTNTSKETAYFYRESDETGKRLTGAKRYTLTLPGGGVPVHGFWSLTLYNDHHFFVPNPLDRYSIGTKSEDLKTDPDGSVTIYIQADSPGDDKRSNWLPSPKEGNFVLYLRAYWPKEEILGGRWTPPALR